MIKAFVTLMLICNSQYLAFGQENAVKEILAYASYLDDRGKDRFALKEYLRAHYYDRNNSNPDINLKISALFSKQSQIEYAAMFLDNFLSSDKISEQAFFDISIRKATMFLNMGSYAEAQLALYAIPRACRNKDLDLFTYYLGIAQLFSDQHEKGLQNLSSLSYVDSSEAIPLEQYCDKLEKISRKNHYRAILLSAMLPGLGQAANGDYKDAANSLMLNGGLLYLFFEVADALSTSDAVVSVGPWLFRYYIGGLKNAQASSFNKMRRQKSKVLLDLNQYLQQCKN